jgi:hypothetical protein
MADGRAVQDREGNRGPAPRANPYAPPTSVVEDKGPPSRFALACTALLHALWCALIMLVISARLAISAPRSPAVNLALGGFVVVAVLYGFTIYRLWGLRRWAWRVCWIPVVVALIGSLLVLRTALVHRDALHAPGWVAFAVILVPGILLVPLQWKVRRDWAGLARTSAATPAA